MGEKRLSLSGSLSESTLKICRKAFWDVRVEYQEVTWILGIILRHNEFDMKTFDLVWKIRITWRDIQFKEVVVCVVIAMTMAVAIDDAERFKSGLESTLNLRDLKSTQGRRRLIMRDILE